MTQEIELGDFKYSINIEGKTASVLEGKPYQKELIIPQSINYE